jgi:hypothetical protein
MFIEDKNSVLKQATDSIMEQMSAQGYDGSQVLEIQWAPTTVLSLETNTKKRFKAVLKDNMGKFKADIRRNGDDVKIYFEGVGTRDMSLEQARWEFDMMWDCLAKNGCKVEVMA